MSTAANARFNCTFIELKFVFKVLSTIMNLSFNCTFMELKLKNTSLFCFSFGQF